jgi:hypothetical protein
MIPINRNFDPQIVEWHYQSIRNYLNGPKMRNKFKKIESLIKSFTGGQYTFETLVKAPFSTIENKIIPAWNAFSSTKKSYYKKPIKLFGTLYTYLGNNHLYNFTDNKRATIYYNTNFLFSHLKLNICPYCNENYTYFFSNNGKRNYEIDHFYSQADYPILAISFFNLVPSCKVCNFFKNDNPTPILSPYYNYKINDILEWGIEVMSSAYMYDETQLEIKKYRGTSLSYLSRINDNLTVFHLEDRYAKRKDIVMDTLKRKQLYNEDYIAQLYRNYEGTLFRNIEDVRAMIFNTEMIEEDYNKRPFSKLIGDIFHGKY